MFRLRQRTRRQLCRAGFLTACLLPVVALALLGLFQRTRAHVRHEEHALRQALGLRVEIGAVEHPRPGIVRYRGVDLAELETGERIARCALVRVQRSAFNGSADLIVRGLAVERAGMAAGYAIVERLLHRREGDPDVSMTFALDDIAFSESSEPRTLARATGLIRADRSEGEARITFDPAHDASADAATKKESDRIRLAIGRRWQQGAPANEVELHTAGHSIPCAWLTALVGELAGLKESSFAGSMRAKNGQDGWQVFTRGAFTHVDLGELGGKYLGHRIEGWADIDVESAHVVGGQLAAIKGRVSGGPGRIEQALLTTCSKWLECAAAVERQPTSELVRYRELGLAFEMDSHGRLFVVGQCSGSPGTLLTNISGGPLLTAPSKPQSVLRLISALAGDEAPAVPGTPRAAMLMRLLPIGTQGGPVHETATRPQILPRPPGKTQAGELR